MRKLVVLLVALGACGEVVDVRQQGAACTQDSQCGSSFCSDGVCCDRACDTTCEACTAASTGATNGTCAPVTANTDPDVECEASGTVCGSTGAGCNGSSSAPGCVMPMTGTSCDSCVGGMATTSACDGNGTCVAGTEVSCGQFACDGAGLACRTACTRTTEATDCLATGYCNVAGTCAKRLRIAMETGATSCLLTESFPLLQAALNNRGHVATIVTGDMIDTDAELANYDVVLIGSMGNGCTQTGWAIFATALRTWVNAGGGFLASGWAPYNGPPADIGAILPTSGASYFTGPQTVTPAGTHPIANGLGSFLASATYLPYGGSPKAGATSILDVGATTVGLAWDVGAGRVVYLGLLYVDSWTSYQNQTLSNGSNAPALEMFIRAVEWSGKSL